MKRARYIFVVIIIMIISSCQQHEPITDFNVFNSLCQEIYSNDSLVEINISRNYVAINFSSTTSRKIVQKDSVNQLDSELISILAKLSNLKFTGFSRFIDHLEFYKNFPLFYTGKCYSIWYFKDVINEYSIKDERKKIGYNTYLVYCSCWSI